MLSRADPRSLNRRREDLLYEIKTMDDVRWTIKIEVRSGRSALALVLGRLLAGDRHGLFAHDMAHHRDLQRSVQALRDEGHERRAH